MSMFTPVFWLIVLAAIVQVNAAGPSHVPLSRRASDVDVETDAEPQRAPAPTTATVDNPMAVLLNKLESGELGDKLLSFDVLIVAFRRKMLLDACMAKLGSTTQTCAHLYPNVVL